MVDFLVNGLVWLVVGFVGVTFVVAFMSLAVSFWVSIIRATIGFFQERRTDSQMGRRPIGRGR
jgi:5-bromo-4-chloroindolyl phosphate hydrolysis protein